MVQLFVGANVDRADVPCKDAGMADRYWMRQRMQAPGHLVDMYRMALAHRKADLDEEDSLTAERPGAGASLRAAGIAQAMRCHPRA